MNLPQKDKISEMHKSFKSVIQTFYDMVTKGLGGVPIAIGMKWIVWWVRELRLL